MFGRFVLISESADKLVAGKVGVVIDITPDHSMYYVQLDDLTKHWVRACLIVGFKKRWHA